MEESRIEWKRVEESGRGRKRGKGGEEGGKRRKNEEERGIMM